MDSRNDGSNSRWFCQKCERPITKTGYTACECGCKTWVKDGTNEKWLIVDSPLASPPLNNKGPILLSDEGESEEDYELLEGKEEWWSLLRVKTTTSLRLRMRRNLMMRSRMRRCQITRSVNARKKRSVMIVMKSFLQKRRNMFLSKKHFL